jgi:hypothetical protein
MKSVTAPVVKKTLFRLMRGVFLTWRGGWGTARLTAVVIAPGDICVGMVMVCVLEEESRAAPEPDGSNNCVTSSVTVCIRASPDRFKPFITALDIFSGILSLTAEGSGRLSLAVLTAASSGVVPVSVLYKSADMP